MAFLARVAQVNNPNFLPTLERDLARLRRNLGITSDWEQGSTDFEVSVMTRFESV